MPDLIDIAGLSKHVDQGELAQLAGVGSHNAPEGRSLDEEQINAAIRFADDLVKSYVSKRFPIVTSLTPETSPDLLQGYVSDIVRYRLRSRTGDRNTVTEEVQRRYDAAMSWLKDVARGTVNVDFGDVDGGQEASDAGASNPSGSVHANIPPGRAEATLDGYL